MKPYQKKLLFSVVLFVLGITLLANSFEINAPLKAYIGNWAVWPFMLTILFSMACVFGGGWFLKEGLLEEKIDDQTVWEVIVDKAYDSCFPVMKWIDQFQGWLNRDDSK